MKSSGTSISTNRPANEYSLQMSLQILVQDEQDYRPIDEACQNRLVDAVRLVLTEHGFQRGEISLAILDDPQIHSINRQFLEHDWPTDVITFPFEADQDWLDGEIVISRETADREAQNQPWPPDDELMLYAIHGALHLVGFDDQTDDKRHEMKVKEREYLEKMKVPSASSHR